MNFVGGTTMIALAALGGFAAPSRVHAQATWGGYVQTRFATDYRNTTGFSIRRAKLYTDGIAPFDSNLSVRVQAIFRWQNAGTFTLQDAYADYRFSNTSFRFGQFVPEFSLQRIQSDAVIPVVERALAVDALIPSAETYARDIGMQIRLYPSNHWHLTLGVFNGNGGNQSGNIDRHLLYVARPTFDATLFDSIRVHGGMSFAYRDKSDMTFKRIFGNLIPFSGKDFRWGGEWSLSSSRWGLQTEYLQANLGGRTASGYYVIGTFSIDRADEVVGLVDRLDDLDPATQNATWYGGGWNHYFAGNRFKIQCVGRVQFDSGHNQYATTVQLQTYIQ
jgi:phosphate-selective porin